MGPPIAERRPWRGAPSTINATDEQQDHSQGTADRARPRAEAVATWNRPLLTAAEQATGVWLWRTRRVARRSVRSDSPRPAPCSFGLRPAELRQHAARLLALGWSREEVLERLDIPPHAIPEVPAPRRPR